MSKSGRVRFADLRRAYRLIHECRDLGHDPTAWSRHAARALAPLVGAQFVLALHIRFGRPGGVPDAALLHGHGWSSPRHWAYWYKRYVVSEQGVQLPALKQFATLSGPLITRTREQLVDDAAWYGSAEFQELFRSLGCDDFLVSFRRWDDPLSLFGFTLIRPLGEKRHGGRERRLVHLFMDELSRHLGAALALEPGGVFAALGPRLRQTLDCLLEGDSEKQAAARLGLSRHTVHEYVTALYRRFDVQSRAELMAFCLKRRL
jgi:DNA-binding CsgD family transcriptional regulator